MPFQLVLAMMLALAAFLQASGMQVSGHLTAQAFSQAILLLHMAGGILLALLVPLSLAYHPVRPADISKLRAIVGAAMGCVATLGAVLAVGFGLALPLGADQMSRPVYALWHCRAAGVFVAVLFVHVALSWTLRHRLVGSRPMAIARAAAIGLVALTIGTVGAAALVPRPATTIPIPKGYKLIGAQPKTPFTPGRQQTSHKQFIPVTALSGSFSCGTSGCHTQITEEWKSSTHRHAARNDHYRGQVALRIHDVPVKPHAGARFCSGCHEPIAVLAGEVDPGGRGIDFSENLEEGISCLACHRITDVRDTTGNASYVITPPILPTRGDAGRPDWLVRSAIAAKPTAHRAELMRPLLRESTACAPCHQLTLGAGILKEGSVSVQETFDEWQHSPFAMEPDPAARKRCQDCHMPLVDSTDPAARHGKHRSHRFLGANTMRPWLDKDEQQLKMTQDFLRSGAVTLSVKAGEPTTAPGVVPVVVGVTNVGVGHRFPTGTVDMHDIWIELIVTDADGKQVFASGLIDPKTLDVDPGAAQFRSTPVDKNDNWLYRRDLWNIAHFRKRKSIADTLEIGRFGYVTLGQRPDFFNLMSYATLRSVWPGMTDEEPYAVPVPPGTKGPLTAAARLRYRKSNQRFTNFVFDPRPLRDGVGYKGPHKQGVSMPITDMATARVTLPLPAR